MGEVSCVLNARVCVNFVDYVKIFLYIRARRVYNSRSFDRLVLYQNRLLTCNISVDKFAMFFQGLISFFTKLSIVLASHLNILLPDK